jgi:hypothetical protein
MFGFIAMETLLAISTTTLKFLERISKQFSTDEVNPVLAQPVRESTKATGSQLRGAMDKLSERSEKK